MKKKVIFDKRAKLMTISVEEMGKQFTKVQRERIESRKQYLSAIMKIKEKRQAMDLSQEEAAKRAGINRVTLTRLESGEGNATVNTLIKMAGAVDMRLNIGVY